MENKIPCASCGVAILQATALKTGGFCIPCKQKIDMREDYKQKQEAKKQKIILFRKKYERLGRLLTEYFVILFMLTTLILQINHGYPSLSDTEEMAIFSTLFLLFNIALTIFLIGYLFYRTYRFINYDKNT